MCVELHAGLPFGPVPVRVRGSEEGVPGKTPSTPGILFIKCYCEHWNAKLHTIKLQSLGRQLH